MSRNREICEESGEKDKETEEDKMPRHEKHPPFRWVSICGIFYCKTGDFFKIFDPPGGVRAIYIYIYAGELVLVPFFLPYQESGTVPHKKKSFLQQPEANQELETDPPDS